jgi:hypothetical protein
MALQVTHHCSICDREPEESTGFCPMHPNARLDSILSETEAESEAESLTVETFDAPAHWASAFVNGDTSGLESADYEAFKAFCTANDEPAVVDCGEPFIGRFDGLVTELCTYTYHVGSK